MSRSRNLLATVALAVAFVVALGGTAQAEPPECSGEPSSIQTLNITVAGVPTYGYYALPSGTPKGVVVLGHGYPSTAQSMVHCCPPSPNATT